MVRGSDPMVGPIGPYNENALNLILEHLILNSHTKLKKKTKYILVMMYIKLFTLIVKSMAIGSGGSGPTGGPIWPYSETAYSLFFL